MLPEENSGEPVSLAHETPADGVGSDARTGVTSEDFVVARVLAPEGQASGAAAERESCNPEALLTAAPPPAAISGAGDQRLTARALRVGAERARLLKLARPYFGQYTYEEIGGLVECSAATVCRLRQLFGHLPDEQLTPELCAAKYAEMGRKSPWEILAQQAEVRQRLQQLYLLSIGASGDNVTRGRRTGSLAAALDVFAGDPLCPAELAAQLRRGRQPKPLVRVIRALNDLHEQKHRGPKHSSLNGTLIQRRSLVEVLDDATTRSLTRGDYWVFDDMSDNFPHWWEGPEGIQFVGRQGLYAFDPGFTEPAAWIGVEKIGTVRDSYTAAIILRFIRHLVQSFGKPRRGVVFERSIWQARTIKGIRLTTDGELVDELMEREPMPAEDKTLVQDGLKALGLIVHYTYTPRGKEIEGAFNYLQRIKPMIAGQRGVNLGRHAGEFEHATKQMRRARARSHTPEELGFLHIDASRDLDLQVMGWINERSVAASRESADSANSRSRLPYPELAPPTDRDLAVFLPEKRELELRGGKVTATVAGQPLDFCAPELFARLGSGYRLVVAFDPSEPTLGAAIYNRETSSANFAGWQAGEFIGWAPFLAPVARFDWRTGDVADPQADAKRIFNKHVRTSYGAVGLNHRLGTARDGRGNVVTASADYADGRRLNSPRPAPSAESAQSADRLALPARRNFLAAPSPEEFLRKRERLARGAAASRALMALNDS